MENSPLAKLPREIRDKIYTHTILEDDELDKEKGLEQHLSRYEWRSFHHFSLIHPILRTCRQLKTECLPIYFENNHFIESPWRIHDKSHRSAECDFPEFMDLIRHYYNGNIMKFGIRIEDDSMTSGMSIMPAHDGPSPEELASNCLEMVKLCKVLRENVRKHKLQSKNLVVQIRYIVPLLRCDGIDMPPGRVPVCLLGGEESTCDLMIDISPCDLKASLKSFVKSCRALAPRVEEETENVVYVFDKEQRREKRGEADIIGPAVIRKMIDEVAETWMGMLEMYHGAMIYAMTDAWSLDPIKAGELEERLKAILLGEQRFRLMGDMVEATFGRKPESLVACHAFAVERDRLRSLALNDKSL